MGTYEKDSSLNNVNKEACVWVTSKLVVEID